MQRVFESDQHVKFDEQTVFENKGEPSAPSGPYFVNPIGTNFEAEATGAKIAHRTKSTFSAVRSQRNINESFPFCSSVCSVSPSCEASYFCDVLSVEEEISKLESTFFKSPRLSRTASEVDTMEKLLAEVGYSDNSATLLKTLSSLEHRLESLHTLSTKSRSTCGYTPQDEEAHEQAFETLIRMQSRSHTLESIKELNLMLVKMQNGWPQLEKDIVLVLMDDSVDSANLETLEKRVKEIEDKVDAEIAKGTQLISAFSERM